MKRLLGFALLLMAVNVVCQVALAFMTRHIDLGFGTFAGLVLIPLFQGAIVVIVSPEPGRPGLGEIMKAIAHDRLVLATGTAALIVAVLLSWADGRHVWPVVLGVLSAACACLTIVCYVSAKGSRRLPLLAASLVLAFLALDALLGVLRRIPPRLDGYPTVIVLLATYLPPFVVTIVVLLSMESVLRKRCSPAAWMIDVAVFLAVAGSLVVAANYFHQPILREPWRLVVRETTFLSFASVCLAGMLFLRHDRGGHVESA